MKRREAKAGVGVGLEGLRREEVEGTMMPQKRVGRRSEGSSKGVEENIEGVGEGSEEVQEKFRKLEAGKYELW